MRRCLHIALVLLLATACGPRTISREDMENILYDILIQEQQIRQDRDLKRIADTSLVYEGIFRKYGYSTPDYLHTLPEYLEESEKMEKLMGSVAERLEAESKLVSSEVDAETWRNRFLRIYGMTPDTTRRPKLPERAVDTLRIRFMDDSVQMVYPADTLQVPFQ